MISNWNFGNTVVRIIRQKSKQISQIYKAGDTTDMKIHLHLCFIYLFLYTKPKRWLLFGEHSLKKQKDSFSEKFCPRNL